MRKTIFLMAASLFAALPAVAQTTRASGNRPMSIAPPPDDDEGTTTILLGNGNGYIRVRDDDKGSPDEEAEPIEVDEGTFSVMSRDHAAESKSAIQPAPVAATEMPVEELAPAAPIRLPPPPPDCRNEEALLAQRLMQTRGVYLDPDTALITLPQLEVPFSPYLTRSMFGTTTPYLGGTILASAILWDTETQQLTQRLAACLLH